MSHQFDDAWIVPKDSDLGQELASFSDSDWKSFCDHLERGYSITVNVKEVDQLAPDYEQSHHDFPAFLFQIDLQRLDLINNLDELSKLARSIRSESGT